MIEPPASAILRTRRLLPRFSLADLLLLIALACTGVVIVQRWEAWGVWLTLDGRWHPSASYDLALAEGCLCAAPPVFTPDECQVFVLAPDSKAVNLWDPHQGHLVRSFRGHAGLVRRFDLSADSRRLVTVSDDRTAIVWEIATGLPVSTPFRHPQTVLCAAFSPDGRFMATGCADEIVRLWEVDTCRFKRTFNGHRGTVQRVAFSRSGEEIFSEDSIGGESHGGSYITDETTRVWDAAAGTCLQAWNMSSGTAGGPEIPIEVSRRLNHPRDFNLESHDGRWVIRDDFPRAEYLFDRTTQCRACTLAGCPVLFSPGDTYLVTADDVDKITLWTQRHPPEWWGHFHRPEVWAAIGILAAWGWVRWGRHKFRPLHNGN